MSVEALLTALTARGVNLSLGEEDRLSVTAPRGALPPELVAQIRERKGELVHWLRAARGRHAGPTSAEALPAVIPDATRLHEPFAPADLQRAFLMGERPDMELHVRPHYYVELEREGLDPARFAAALNAMLVRQRRNLPVVTEDLQLVIPRQHAPVDVRIDDLRTLAPEEQEARLQATREAMSRQILPLDRWPWLECRISLYGRDRARVHYNNNNFFSDGYGSQRLIQETFRACDDPARALPELSLGFRDAAEAIARIEASPRGQESLRYWQERIPGLPGSLALPVRPGFQARIRSRLDRRSGFVSAETWASLKRRAAGFGLTPTNTLYAAYAELVSRWSGSRHFLLNNMVTHRFPFHPEIKDIIGNFASLYPLEVDWRGELPFSERARALQSRVMTDLQQVYCSGVTVLQALNRAQRTPGRASCPFVVGSGLFMEPIEKPHFSCLETSQVLLDHQFWELTDGRMWFVWDLVEEAFPAGLVDDMWGAYLQLLEALASDERAWASTALDLLPERQRAVRLRANAAGAPVTVGRLHDALIDAAARAPAGPALFSAGATSTWAELEGRAARLAGALGRAGVLPGELVPVVLPKGGEQVEAVFGVLYAGGAYVPVDPAWPADRIAVVLDSVGARRVVASDEVVAARKLPAEVQVVTVGEGSGAERGAPIAPPVLGDPGEVAYVIFTSGSTGTPKGVAISHAGALNTIADVNRRFGVGPDDRLLCVSSLCFDLSVYDLFGAAAAGAALVMPTGAEVASPRAWLDLMARHRVTVWNSAPALMQLLVETAQATGQTLPELRLVLLSGDWIPVAMPDQIRAFAPNAQVVSLGGATEASIWSIFHPVDRVDPAWVSIPYGRPLANQRWHVLDASGADAPTWVPGDLHIGGRGLALGYWGDREKTERAFAPHPRTGERLYRTGDLGRYLPDGAIEFLGRSDSQVKIQGFRIELGEVEHALASHPAVQAAVALVADGAGGKQLVAFVVRRPEHAQVDAAAILAQARTKLPAHMVPATLGFIDAVPLSSNGKVDRKALLQTAPEVREARREHVPPRSELERALATIWQEVLSVERVGVRDDFFELGGQSFAAIRVTTRIGKQLGRSVPLGAILQGRTVEALAAALEREDRWTPLATLRAGEGQPLFLVHPAGGNVLCYRHLAEVLERPVHGLQAAGLDGSQPPADGIEDMATRYLEAVRGVQAHGPYVLGGWSSGGVVAFEMARQLEAAGEAVARVILLDTPAPLQRDLPSEPALLRWFLEDVHPSLDPAALARLAVPAGAAPPAQLAAALGALRESLPPSALEAQHLEHVYEVFRRIVVGCRRYQARPIAADLVILRASEGRVSEFHRHPADAEPDWGWGAFTRGRRSAGRLPGTHYTILDRERCPGVVAELARAEAALGGPQRRLPGGTASASPAPPAPHP